MLDESLREKRERIVLDHFESEVRQDWDEALGSFSHPRYEIIPACAVLDGEAAVRGYHHVTHTAFPDRHHEMINIRHSDDAVICEFYLMGTHLGPHGNVAATGQPFKVQMTGFFIFENDQLVCERVYFDAMTMLKQLLRGKNFKRPSNWPFLWRVFRGLLP